MTKHHKMKSILAILMAGTLLSNAVTITINQDSANELDFTIIWGANPGEYNASASHEENSVEWLAGLSRNRNYYYVQIDNEYYPSITGFGLRFWGDPEYRGPVPTAFGSPNISLSGATLPQMFPLNDTPYGARFVYGVPESDSAWILMCVGLVGVAIARYAMD